MSYDATKSTAAVTPGIVGAPTQVRICLRDSAGVQLPAGGDSGDLDVTVSGANSATPAVTDNGDGTYTAVYVPTATGTDTVTIEAGGDEILGSPYSNVVVTKPAAKTATSFARRAGR